MSVRESMEFSTHEKCPKDYRNRCSLLATTQGAATPLPSPKNWKETQKGNSRVLAKGTSRLEIGPWQKIEGVKS